MAVSCVREPEGAASLYADRAEELLLLFGSTCNGASAKEPKADAKWAQSPAAILASRVVKDGRALSWR